MSEVSRGERRDAITEAKKAIILRAARTIFERDGLEAASIRAIAKAAGYTPGALYGYFPSKEHIYAALLGESLARLHAATHSAAASGAATKRFQAAGLAFFNFYDTNPRDLDLGFYLFRGGIRPHGLSRELNAELNAQLLACLQPLADAATDLGATAALARNVAGDVLAYSSGLLLLAHTKRLNLFGGNPRDMMHRYLVRHVDELRRKAKR